MMLNKTFSFQVAPEAIIEELVPRHHAFDTPVDEFEGRLWCPLHQCA